MRLKRWIEGRISGRKSRLKDGSTTSADDQFVYHPSPFRHQLSHIATPSHNPPPKLHHQLEQRLNEQLKERLSGHFTSIQLNGSIAASNNANRSELSNVQLRRTASALDSRSKARKLFNRASEYQPVEQPPRYAYGQRDSPLLYGMPHQPYIDPYSLPSEVNLFDGGALTNSYPINGLTSYEPPYQNDCLTDFGMQRREPTNYPPNCPNRYSSITQASNESAFFDCSSPSLAQDGSSPSLGKCQGTPLIFLNCIFLLHFLALSGRPFEAQIVQQCYVLNIWNSQICNSNRMSIKRVLRGLVWDR